MFVKGDVKPHTKLVLFCVYMGSPVKRKALYVYANILKPLYEHLDCVFLSLSSVLSTFSIFQLHVFLERNHWQEENV